MKDLALVTLAFIPIEDKIGMESLYGRYIETNNRIMQRKTPNGIQTNIAAAAKYVGLKANRPSWNINGFGYFSLGRIRHCFFFDLLTSHEVYLQQILEEIDTMFGAN